MSNFFDLENENLEDAEALSAADAGEYTIELKDWKTDKAGNVIQKDKNDYPYVMPILAITDHENADNFKDFNMFVRLPHADLTAKQKKQVRWDLKCFLEAFSLPITGRIDWDEAVGNKAEAVLALEEGGQYGDQNKVSKLIIGA